jgi:hypothetical protein
LESRIGVAYRTNALKWQSLICIIVLSACTSSIESKSTQVDTDSRPFSTQTFRAIESHIKTPTTTEYEQSTIEASPMVLQPTDTPRPTLIPSPTNTLEPIEFFTSSLLRSGISPQTYFEDTCQYLERRWAKDGSPPGTVVVPIMFHSIYKDGRTVSDPKEISVTEFENFVEAARYLGFETITTAQLYAFLENNASIPERSMIMIVDDRRPGLIQERFMPVLDQFDWSVTAAYIADPDSLHWAWELMDQLHATGRVDIQSHGYSGQLYMVESTSEEDIHSEIEQSTVVLEERYGIRPIAFIWPGGNFTSLSVGIARQDGYRLGFTAYSRGPLMFNWIPLGEEERLIGDPLMLLPRAWSNSAIYNMEQAIEIADAARAYAQVNFQIEARWYNSVCGGDLLPQEEASREIIP